MLLEVFSKRSPVITEYMTKGETSMDEKRKEVYSSEFIRLLEIMEQLRSEKGCEWDKKQTHQSLRPYAIEEAYEVVESIDSGDTSELKKELGDLMLQCIFHAQIAYEDREFDIGDVLCSVSDKMVRRHPHVFSDGKGYSYEQWEMLKSKEDNEKMCRIGKYKRGAPPIIQLRRLFENSLAVGFDPYFGYDVKKLISEDLYSGNYKGVLEKIIYMSVKESINLESLVNQASKEFHERFVSLEKLAGEKFNEYSEEDKIKMWDKIRGEKG